MRIYIAWRRALWRTARLLHLPNADYLGEVAEHLRIMTAHPRPLLPGGVLTDGERARLAAAFDAPGPGRVLAFDGNLKVTVTSPTTQPTMATPQWATTGNTSTAVHVLNEAPARRFDDPPPGVLAYVR